MVIACVNNNKGHWNATDFTCYAFRMIHRACLVLDHDTMELAHNYTDFSCDTIYHKYVNYGFYHYKSETIKDFPGIDELSGPIILSVRSSKDPYSWANLDTVLSFAGSAVSFNLGYGNQTILTVGGFIMIFFALIMTIFPIYQLCIRKDINLMDYEYHIAICE